MGLVRKGENERQRKKMNKSRYGFSKLMTRPENMMEQKDDTVLAPPTRDEVKCEKCGFKARYQFIRCPECGR